MEGDSCAASESNEKSSYVNFLAPEKLMTIKLKINNETVDALIDSGASRSIIKRSLVMNVKPVGNPDSHVVGLGGKKISIIGETEIPTNFYNVELLFKGLVIGDNAIK